MTGPRLFSGVFDSTEPQQQQPKRFAGVFDASPEPAKQIINEQGFWNYNKNIITRGLPLLEVLYGHADPNNPTHQAIVASLNDPIQGQKMKEFGSFFNFLTKDIVAPLKQGISELTSQEKPTSPFWLFNDIGQFAKAIEKPLGDLAELASGVQFTSDDIHALTPEEKLNKVKNVVGTAAMLGVGKTVDAAITAVGVTRGTLASRVLANATVGASGGAALGLVQGAGEDNQLVSILTNGIMGGTLGAAHGLLFGRGKGNIKPEELAQIRQLQSSDNTVGDAIRMASSFSNVNDIASLIISGKIKPEGIIHIPGVDPSKIRELNKGLPENFRSTIHHWGDGTSDLLVHDNSIKVDTKFFEQNGFLPNQEVSHNGSNYFIDGADRTHFKLDNGAVVPKEEVRQLGNVHTPSVTEVIGRLYKEWRPTLDEDTQSSLSQHVQEFLKSKDLSPEHVSQLSREFQNRFAREEINKLNNEDQSIIEDARKQRVLDAQTSKDKVKDWRHLQRVARSNGFDITDGGSGRVIVRSLPDRKVLAGFNTHEEAIKWINKTGQVDGPNLDSNPTFDFNSGNGGNIIPPDEPISRYPSDEAYNYWNRTKGVVGGFIGMINNGSLWTRYSDHFSHLDSKYNSRIKAGAFDPLLELRNKRTNQLKPQIETLEKIKKDAQLSDADARLAYHLRDTMTPEEFIDHGLPKKVGLHEIQFAKAVANSGVDIERIFRYRNELAKLDRGYTTTEREGRAPTTSKLSLLQNPEYLRERENLRSAYEMDNTHLEIAKLFDQIENQGDPSKTSLGAVVSLARLMNNGVGERGMSKMEFIAKHNVSPKVIDVVNKIEASDKSTGISSRLLRTYANYAKLYLDGDLSKAREHFAMSDKEVDYFNNLNKTGEISAFDDNIFKAQARFLKANTDIQSGFADGIANAQQTLREEVQKLPEKIREKVTKVGQRAIGDIASFSEAGDRAAQEGVDYIFDKYKLGDSPDIKRAWASALTRLISVSALGARQMLGLSHLGLSTVLSLAGRGSKYTAKMFEHGGKALLDPKIMEDLRNKGVFQGLAPFADFESQDTWKTQAGDIIDKVEDKLFKATLLPTFYDGMAAGHYITTSQDALATITKYGRNEIPWQQLEKDIQLKRFDEPVIKEFKDRIRSNPTDAAHYLGLQAVDNLVGTFGAGNTPYMWGTNLGRLAGQFGSYSMWSRAAVTRMISRGTVGQKITAGAMLAATAYGTQKASDKLGIDLTRISPFHAMTWLFGPLIHTALDISTIWHGTGIEQKLAKARLLRLGMMKEDKNGLHFAPGPNLFIPFSFAVDGWIKAVHDFDKNPALGAAEALGFRKTGYSIRKPQL